MEKVEVVSIDQYYKVQTGDRRLRIRESSSFDSKIIGFLPNESIIHATKKYGYWIYHDKGWSLSYDINTKETFLIESSKNQLFRARTRATESDVVPYADDFDPNLDDDDDEGYSDDLSVREITMRYGNFDEVTTGQTSSAKELLSRDINGVFGIPYQFSEKVDQPMPGTGFGRKYAEKIVAPMPIIFFSPGRPDFMKTFSNNDKESIVNSFIQNINGKNYDNLDDIIDGYGRYYTFKFAYDEYYTYVNHTLWMLATYMGIDNYEVRIGKVKKRLGAIRWEDTLSTAFTEYIATAEAIPFYLDSETSISESFSNSTTESMLAQKANSLSDMAKELSFVLGDVKDAAIVQSLGDAGAGAQDIATSLLGGIAGFVVGDAGKNFIQRISSQFSTIVAGGKLDFPEIWSDSDFSRSYSINFKFRSPDADNVSIFLNLYVPLVHLICLAAPQQMGSNAYSSPFIVRAFYKGIFNCDYGMITGLNITKGKEGCWNANGLPTVIDVSMELKELYTSFYISQYRQDKFINNTMLIDYLLLMAGVNINKPELTRTLDTYLMTIKGKIFGTPGDIWLGFKNDISNIISGYYKVK